MRLRIAPVLIHASARSGQPSGVARPKISWPRPVTSLSVRPVVSGGASRMRAVLTTSSKGDFTLALYALLEKNSGEVTMTRSVSRMSPSVSMNFSAALSISDSGGESLTKRRVSFVEMNRAVEGCLARMSSTSSPSSMPRPAGRRCPRTNFSSASCISGRKMNPPPASRFQRIRGGSGAPATDQPVKARATSVTSYWV